MSGMSRKDNKILQKLEKLENFVTVILDLV